MLRLAKGTEALEVVRVFRVKPGRPWARPSGLNAGKVFALIAKLKLQPLDDTGQTQDISTAARLRMQVAPKNIETPATLLSYSIFKLEVHHDF